jgi:hypothetical protein
MTTASLGRALAARVTAIVVMKTAADKIRMGYVLCGLAAARSRSSAWQFGPSVKADVTESRNRTLPRTDNISI